MIVRHGGYEIDDDPARVDRDAVWEFLSRHVYWARWRDRAAVDAQIDGAWRVVAAYRPDGATVGFARAISDGVAFAYLADVYVVPAERGTGLGVALVGAMIERGPGARFRWTLHTNDAHELYARFGFAAPDGTYLERPGRFADRAAPPG